MNQAPVNLKNTKILIVDDVPANLNILRQTLEPESYNIIAAPRGEIALRIAQRRQPSLILLDIMMPGIDGLETCRRLKANSDTAEIPVIFITAKDEMKSIVEGFGVGGVDYITKPFRHEEVRARVRTHLTIKRLQERLKDANSQIQAKNSALEKAYSRLEADNARKTEELETAHDIQLGFLPAALPEIRYFDIAAVQKPATEVGGDYYDFFPQADGRLVVAIGDATGHGVGASLMVSATKMALLTVEAQDLARRVARINKLLMRVNRDRLLNMGLAILEFSYDPGSQTVDVSAAGGGMPPFYILRAAGGVEEIVVVGMPLGAMERATYHSIQFRLQKSDTLLLMSDGLPERLNDQDEMLGAARLISEIAKAGTTRRCVSDLLEDLVNLGDNWSNNTPQNDDVTLVVLKVR